MANPVDQRVAVVVSAYQQPNSLRWVLLALARQAVRPSSVIVADDGSGPRVLDMLRTVAASLPFTLRHVWQPDEGFRAARSRNNAIAATTAPILGFLDQDVLPAATWLAAMLSALRVRTVCLGAAMAMALERVPALDDAAARAGAFEAWVAEGARIRLRRGHRRACAYGLLRRLGIGVKSKPQLRSGSFMAWRKDLERVNGFDEAYVGWGQEDDDLGRRLYRAGVRPVVCLATAPAVHIPHRLRRQASWSAGANTERFRQGSSVRCEQGLASRPYGDVHVTTLVTRS